MRRFSNLVEEDEDEAPLSRRGQKEQEKKKQAAAKSITTGFIVAVLIIVMWNLLPFLNTFFAPPFEEAAHNITPEWIVGFARDLFCYAIWFLPFILVGGVIVLYLLAKILGIIITEVFMTPRKKARAR